MSEKVCAVVGVGPGMGLAIVERFAKEGFTVAMMARKQDKLDGFAADFAAQGYQTRGYALDATDAPQIADVFGRIATELGHPDVLVYNASILREGHAMAIDIATFVEDLQLDIVGALVSIQQVYPAMKAAGGGKIILTGGGLALNPQYSAGMLSLGVGKAGMRAMVMALHEELKPDNIHVGTVTIGGMIKPGTFFDPVNIVEKFWELYLQPQDAWANEIVYAQS